MAATQAAMFPTHGQPQIFRTPRIRHMLASSNEVSCISSIREVMLETTTRSIRQTTREARLVYHRLIDLV